VAEKIISTLTLSILKSVYNLISLIFFYKLYFIIISGYPKSILFKITFVLLLLYLIYKESFFYNIIDFLYRNSTTEFILSLIFIKEFYLSFKALL
jgi:hypothetical protein